MIVKAYAKLNLGLRVLGLRTDGFHELHTHMHTVSLADELRFEPTDNEEITVHLIPDLDIPLQDNLVFRAVELFCKQTGTKQGFRCEVTKRIPMGAGLGGGSSDAAATLNALNRSLQTQLKTETLIEMAAALGSDVPFFSQGGFACVRGRGEKLQSLPTPYEGYHFVILVPPVTASTPEVFKMWDILHPKAQFTDKKRCEGIELYNDLETAVCRRYPELQPYAELIRKAPTPLKGMSGSGSAWFAGFPTKEAAVAYQQQLESQIFDLRAYVVKAIY